MIAFTAFGQIFADLLEKGDQFKKSGEAFRVSYIEARHRQICWHPENNRIAFICDRSGYNEVYEYDFQNRKEIQLTKGKTDKFTPKYSPDGKWLA
ncbi:MAG: DPP IV N-terminal domain-containing protein [Calditrichota bacterium]